MYITVQFKDKFKVFKGKTYDFELAPAEEIPKVDSIIRMYTPDFSKQFVMLQGLELQA